MSFAEDFARLDIESTLKVGDAHYDKIFSPSCDIADTVTREADERYPIVVALSKQLEARLASEQDPLSPEENTYFLAGVGYMATLMQDIADNEALNKKFPL